MSEAVVGPYLAQVGLTPPLLPKLEGSRYTALGEALTPQTGIATSSPSTTSSLRDARLNSSPSQLPPVKKEKRRPAPLALHERAASRPRSPSEAEPEARRAFDRSVPRGAVHSGSQTPRSARRALPLMPPGSVPSVPGSTVAVACPALRDDDETKPMRFRGAKQEFYEQTMRIFSKNDMNNRHPGYAPDCSQLADVQVDHQLRKKIELSDRNFYRDPSRVQLQQEASYENRKVRMASLSPESSPKNRSRRGSRTSFGSDLRRNSSTGSMSPKSGRGGNSFAMSPTVSRAGSVRGRSGRRNSGTGSQQLGA